MKSELKIQFSEKKLAENLFISPNNRILATVKRLQTIKQ